MPMLDDHIVIDKGDRGKQRSMSFDQNLFLDAHMPRPCM